MIRAQTLRDNEQKSHRSGIEIGGATINSIERNDINGGKPMTDIKKGTIFGTEMANNGGIYMPDTKIPRIQLSGEGIGTAVSDNTSSESPFTGEVLYQRQIVPGEVISGIPVPERKAVTSEMARISIGRTSESIHPITDTSSRFASDTTIHKVLAKQQLQAIIDETIPVLSESHELNDSSKEDQKKSLFGIHLPLRREKQTPESVLAKKVHSKKGNDTIDPVSEKTSLESQLLFSPLGPSRVVERQPENETLTTKTPEKTFDQTFAEAVFQEEAKRLNIQIVTPILILERSKLDPEIVNDLTVAEKAAGRAILIGIDTDMANLIFVMILLDVLRKKRKLDGLLLAISVLPDDENGEERKRKTTHENMTRTVNSPLRPALIPIPL